MLIGKATDKSIWYYTQPDNFAIASREALRGAETATQPATLYVLHFRVLEIKAKKHGT